VAEVLAGYGVLGPVRMVMVVGRREEALGGLFCFVSIGIVARGFVRALEAMKLMCDGENGDDGVMGVYK
jgi:hypothetical protein